MLEIRVRKSLLMAEGQTDLAVDFQMATGSFCTLYGKSGAGKTTLLKILAGLIQPEESLIRVNGEIWSDTRNKIHLSPQKRKIGFVFQDYALFPNMTVRENLLYAAADQKDLSLIDDLLERVSLGALAHRKPATLSGGQQQRIALIRALVRRPAILLLDEPLSALDPEMRHQLQTEIFQLHKAFQTTTLLVSHQLTEIYRLSDQVIHIERGSIIQSGTPSAVFGQKFSSKIQLPGEILNIQPSDMVYILEILTGNSVIKVVATENEARGLQSGDRVVVFSKAFNPIIRKI